MDNTFWEVVSAAGENLGVKPTWMLRETGNTVPEVDPRIPPYLKEMCVQSAKTAEEIVINWPRFQPCNALLPKYELYRP